MARTFYVYDHTSTQKRPVACLVGESQSKYGISICRKTEPFKKKQGRQDAITRMEKGEAATIPKRKLISHKKKRAMLVDCLNDFISKLPQT